MAIDTDERRALGASGPPEGDDEGTAPPRPLGRRVAGIPRPAIALWALIVLWGAWAAIRLLGAEGGFPLVALIAYTPYVAVGTLVPLGIALLMRRWVAAGVAIAIGVLLASAVLPRALPSTAAAAATDGPRLRVLTANVAQGAADPEALVELVRRTDADVLSVPELTPGLAGSLDRVGLDELLPHSDLAVRPESEGAGLYSRFPLRVLDAGGLGAAPRSVPPALLRPPGSAPLELYGVHPPPPISPTQAGDWRATLRDLPAADRAGPPRILAGDFNATLDHAELRRVLDTGYVDAADAVGEGLTPTWPSDLPLAPVTIDHVLVDERIGVAEVSVHEIAGSDHRAVLAELILPPTQGS